MHSDESDEEVEQQTQTQSDEPTIEDLDPDDLISKDVLDVVPAGNTF